MSGGEWLELLLKVVLFVTEVSAHADGLIVAQTVLIDGQ